MKQLLLFLFFSIAAFSQKKFETVDSNALGESREITIALPASFEKNPSKKYPLLVLLDGDYLFDPFYGALTYGAYWDDLPEMIIVGISQNKNNQRIDDSTYDEADGIPSEKGAKFFEFIATELLPYLEKKYPVAPFRLIAGHDITAGFLNFFLYKENPLFNGYISLSPELAPDMENQIAAKLSVIKQPISYYQSIAEGDIPDIQESVKVLDENIKQSDNSLLHYKFDNFKGASHYSLILYSIPNALYHIFDVYKPISSAEFSEKISILQSGYVDYLVDRYNTMNKRLGLKIPIRINDFKAIEAAILKNKAYNELDQLAEIANKNYPKSMLAEYELGLMYEKQEDFKKAAKRYQNASQMEAIGDLSKTMMTNKYEDMIAKTPKK